MSQRAPDTTRIARLRGPPGGSSSPTGDGKDGRGRGRSGRRERGAGHGRHGVAGDRGRDVDLRVVVGGTDHHVAPTGDHDGRRHGRGLRRQTAGGGLHVHGELLSCHLYCRRRSDQ